MQLILASTYSNLDALLVAGPALLSGLVIGIPCMLYRVRVLAVMSGVVCFGSAFWLFKSLSIASHDSYAITIVLGGLAALAGLALILIKR